MCACACLQPYNASSPEILYMSKVWLAQAGSSVVGGVVQSVPPNTEASVAATLAADMPTYYYLPSGDKFWEERMNQMLDKSILTELVCAR